MLRALVLALACALAPAPARARRARKFSSPPPPLAGAAPVTGEPCVAGWPAQAFAAVGSTLRVGGACLAAAAWPPVDSTALTLAPCDGSPSQSWALSSDPGPNAISLTLTAAPALCANLAGYGTTPGTQAWLYACSPADCKGNCAWARDAALPGALRNAGADLCLNAGAAPPPGPPPPHTCDPGSPSAGLPFCDAGLPVRARVEDLFARLSDAQRVQFFSVPAQPNDFDAALNLPAVFWDITCIAGLSPGRFSPTPNVTVFPNTIGQAASFDVGLVARIGAATALEGRVVNQVNYARTRGTTWQGVLCDGGPLANTAHDPRWGRTSETYGEDVFLTQAMGVAATRALQQRTAPDAATGLSFLAASQVTRHYMGTHGATDMSHDAEEYILPQWREEHQLRIYEAFQRPDRGGAEGVMCAISAFATAGDVPPPRNNLTTGVLPWTPNCANNYLLQEKLRDAWGSDAFVQSDCCDSIDAVLDHDYVATLPEAVAAVLDAGLTASYGDPAGITAALAAARASGLVANATFDAAIKRTLLTLFRVGMFDTNSTANPFRGPFDEAALDGPAHRALAREAAAKSYVLLENRAGALPLAALPGRVAVIGPFSDCTKLGGSYAGQDVDFPNFACSYSHSYVGSMSAVSTLRAAAVAEATAAGGGVEVRWAQGSGFQASAGPDALANASAAAAWADLVVLAVGLGSTVEAEGRDRVALGLSGEQAALVAAVAGATRAGATLVVAIASAGGVDVVVPRADAVVQLFYPGEEAGAALWDVLLGRVVPSARLPETVYANEYLALVEPEVNFNMVTRGTGRTYRFFNETRALGQNASVAAYTRYRFGYGLSYCTFAYSNIALSYNASAGSVGVDVDVAVAGSAPPGLACTEVTQVYLTLPPAPFVTPIYSLVAFAATPLPAAGAPPTHLRFDVADYDLWTTYVDGARALAGGTYTFAVGGHLPDDAKGAAASNALVATIEVAAPAARASR